MAGEAGTSSTPMAAHVYEPFDVAESAIGSSLPEASVRPTPLAPLRLTKNDDDPGGLGHVCCILLLNVTEHPTAAWTAQQVADAFPWDEAPRYLLRDRDRTYGDSFRQRVRHMGIREVVIAPRSPWQNPYVERLAGRKGVAGDVGGAVTQVGGPSTCKPYHHCRFSG
jgi:hypothetical protein